MVGRGGVRVWTALLAFTFAAAPPRAAAFLAPGPGRLRAPDLCASRVIPKSRALRVRGGAGAARMVQDLMLVTNKMCPFAQKAWIVLEEKKAAHGVDYKLEEIGLCKSPMCLGARANCQFLLHDMVPCAPGDRGLVPAGCQMEAAGSQPGS
jgi:hypothetical protein